MMMKLTAILAMTADGKISDRHKTRATFASAVDKQHLRERLTEVDAILFGAGTLRAYGTTITIPNSQWQPINIVISPSGRFSPGLPFFTQPVSRWLITTSTGAKFWQNESLDAFERLIINNEINWLEILTQLNQLGITKLAVLGGGELVASLLTLGLIDEFWLTICPIMLGGKDSPTPVDGIGLPSPQLLELLSVHRVGQELFLHYKCINNLSF